MPDTLPWLITRLLQVRERFGERHVVNVAVDFLSLWQETAADDRRIAKLVGMALPRTIGVVPAGWRVVIAGEGEAMRLRWQGPVGEGECGLDEIVAAIRRLMSMDALPPPPSSASPSDEGAVFPVIVRDFGECGHMGATAPPERVAPSRQPDPAPPSVSQLSLF